MGPQSCVTRETATERGGRQKEREKTERQKKRDIGRDGERERKG